MHIDPVILIAGQDDLEIGDTQVELVHIGHEEAYVGHVATRPVVDHVLEEDLVIEDEEDRGARQLDVHIPRLHVVPHERIVDLYVEHELLGRQELLEGHVGVRLHLMERAAYAAVVAVLLRQPRYAALEQRARATLQVLHTTHKSQSNKERSLFVISLV